MKKIITIIMIIICMTSFAAAESIDLSGLSFDQLIALKDRINMAIWKCQEWQEVVVPQGLYVVGEDIPEGTWTILAAVDHFTVVSFGDKLEANGIDIAYSDRYGSGQVWSGKERNFHEGSDLTSFTFTAKRGDYIQIDYASALFTPYAGKPDLGFFK